MNSPQIVTFFLDTHQPRAWLVINRDFEEPRVMEMGHGYADHWSATAWLRPGDYHCRYYCGDDNHAVYHGPAQRYGKSCNDMDGLVSVEFPRQVKIPPPIHILLVEDNLITLNACAKLLSGDGYSVHIADGYQSALTTARLQPLDLAICDINLWDGDGCDLLGELKLLQPLKAIAMTGYTLPEETEHYREAGFSVVLQKPTSHSELTSSISTLGFSCPAVHPKLQVVPN